MFGFDDLAVAGVSAIGNLISGNSNAKAAREAFKNRYQDTVKDMKKAGLNPALAYGQGGGNPTTHDKPLLGESVMSGVAASMSAKATKAQIDQTKTASLVNIQSAQKLAAETNLINRTSANTIEQSGIQTRIMLADAVLRERQGDTELAHQKQIAAAVQLAQLDAAYQAATFADRVAMVQATLKKYQVEITNAQIETILKRLEIPGAKVKALGYNSAQGALNAWDKSTTERLRGSRTPRTR